MIRILRIYKAFTFFPIQSEVFIRFCRSSYISIAQHFQPSNLSFSVYCFHSARTHFTVSFMEKSGEVCRRRLPEEGSPQCSGQLHVLAVDDSHVDRKVIERLLRISSCKVTAVESGTRALQFLGLEGAKTSGIDGLKVNLIMTDYSMPGMTGYELLKKIKESSDYREVPVVVMSSENIFARIDRCLEEGAEEFIVKPVKLSDVKRLKDFVITKGKSDETRGRRSEKRKLRDEENGFSDNPARNCEVSTQLRKKPRLCEMN